jgi:hypothetical protein
LIGHLYRTDLHESEPRQEILHRITRGDEHTIAGRYPVRAKPTRRPFDLFLRLGVGPRAVAREQPELARRVVDGSTEKTSR